jgi:hypothetical protein
MNESDSEYLVGTLETRRHGRGLIIVALGDRFIVHATQFTAFGPDPFAHVGKRFRVKIRPGSNVVESVLDLLP